MFVFGPMVNLELFIRVGGVGMYAYFTFPSKPIGISNFFLYSTNSNPSGEVTSDISSTPKDSFNCSTVRCKLIVPDSVIDANFSDQEPLLR